MSGGLRYKIRPAREGDRAFICDSWSRSARDAGDDTYWVLDQNVYFPLMRGYASRVLDKGKVLVICLADDDDEIVGYRAWDWHGVERYTYLKYVYRVFADTLTAALEAHHGTEQDRVEEQSRNAASDA
jgi:hypothetical protein